MTQNETQAEKDLRTCDIRHDAGSKTPAAPAKEDTRSGGYTPPVTRSPYDPWHSEEYLVSCLVKTHGWHWKAARVLAGPWRAGK